MTEAEWLASDDACAMLEFLWQQLKAARSGNDLCGPNGGDALEANAVGVEADSVRALHELYLASCRHIWRLLPQEASRRGIELAEQHLAGVVTAEEVSDYNWHTEAAAFCFEYDSEPESIARWVAEVRALPEPELQRMLHPPEIADQIDPRELLARAAYFADYAMIYPSIRPLGPPQRDHCLFLSAEVLRQYVGYPTIPRGSEAGD